MKDESIKEFEAIFEQASIPALDVQKIDWQRIGVVCKGTEQDKAALQVASYFKRRFKCEITTFTADGISPAESVDDGNKVYERAFSSTEELVGQVSVSRCQLVIVPDPQYHPLEFFDLDTFLQGTHPPLLLIRENTQPENIFSHILHSLSGEFTQAKNFHHSFSLTEKNGELFLFHAISPEEIHHLQHILQLSDLNAESDEESVINTLSKAGEKYLRSVVASAIDQPFNVQYKIENTDVVTGVLKILEQQQSTLLVVGCHHEGYSNISAIDYQLIQKVRNIPVLAL